jgi:uncharacterized protein YyaL (SSP411 family)
MSQPNRLAQETSPYLLQHAHNPVDWYPWGPEAFEAARKQDKPIFLSVGYSTCYWCHVMERQSFENPQVAAEMNSRFINIKVDREERPDIDQLYMTAVQVLTQRGGWPMSVWLTPDLKPFYGGTYFPPEDAHGRPGFVTILTALEDAYRNRQAEVSRSANQLVNVLKQVSQLAAPTADLMVDQAWLDRMIARSTSDYEPKYGGFGRAPKFPRETLLELLLHWLQSPDADGKLVNRVKQELTHTLDAMAYGGIRDQLGGGFHRYSTDAQWLVPHFEIMLYDNAMLGWIYAQAAEQLGEWRYAQVARGVFDFVLREMTSPAGTFYTAFDAEVDHQEGLNYLWKLDEVEQVLGQDDADLFARVYGLDQGPNFADPHHSDGGPDKSILFIADVNLAEKEEKRLSAMRAKLKAIRDQRKQPLLDTKILTSWNALMIRALAHAGKVLKEQRYLNAAAGAAEALLKEHRQDDGSLYRTSRDGVKKHAAMLDDYAFLADALLTLHDATGDKKWRDHAADVARVMYERFADREKGGFFFTEESAADLIVRQKVGTDSPLPSGNAVAVQVLLKLGIKQPAEATIKAFAQQADAHGEGMSAMVQSALRYVQAHGDLKVDAGAGAPDALSHKPEDIASQVVTVGAAWESSVSLRVTLAIKEGYHVNANPAGEGLIATELLIDGAELESITYPDPVEKSFAFAEKPIPVYEGQTGIVVTFKDQPSGQLTLTLVYQACDDNACLPPVRKQAVFEV